MSDTPSNNAEKYNFFDFEREVQKQLDIYYRSRKHEPDRSKADKTHDVILDGKKVEEKIRGGRWGDILVEITQDIASGAAGWFSETKCDYLHYVFCPDDKTPIPTILYRIRWPSFKSWFICDYLKDHKKGQYVYSGRGWGATLNIPVPICQIPGTVMTTFKIEFEDF